jgi:hypothetical protein
MRKSWSVGVIAGRIGLGSARASRAGDRVLAIVNFLKDCFGETPKPARETRALPRRRIRTSPFFLHHQHEGADERGSEDESDALQWPDVIGHERFADLFHRE